MVHVPFLSLHAVVAMSVLFHYKSKDLLSIDSMFTIALPGSFVVAQYVKSHDLNV